MSAEALTAKEYTVCLRYFHKRNLFEMSGESRGGLPIPRILYKLKKNSLLSFLVDHSLSNVVSFIYYLESRTKGSLPKEIHLAGCPYSCDPQAESRYVEKEQVKKTQAFVAVVRFYFTTLIKEKI